MGIDPGYRTGCKVAVISKTGSVLDHVNIYPTKPQEKIKESKEILAKLIKKYDVSLIAIGNGTASRETEKVVVELINELKKEDVIYQKLIFMANYIDAKKEFLDNEVTEDLVCLIGMNRKSKTYDKIFFQLYKLLKAIFINKNNQDYLKIFEIINKITGKSSIHWKKLVFNTNKKESIKKNKENSIIKNCPFYNYKNEKDFKETFFKYFHTFKAMATLEDYFDLNRRYLALTETFIFEDNIIKLDVFPKYYFKEIISNLIDEAFVEAKNLKENIEIDKISDSLKVDLNRIYSNLSKDLNVKINNPNEASKYISVQQKEYEYTTGEIHKLIGREYVLKVRMGNINRVSLNKETNEILLVTDSENVENRKKIMDKWYFDCARKLFPDVVDKWLKILNESIEHLSIKPMKTRWGSCNYNKRYINLNTELIKRTPFEIEYVVLHELTHLKYPNHGKSFYNYIERYMPNYKIAEKMLNAKHYY